MKKNVVRGLMASCARALGADASMPHGTMQTSVVAMMMYRRRTSGSIVV